MPAAFVLRLLLLSVLARLLAACSQRAGAIDFSQRGDQTALSLDLPSGNIIRVAVAPVLSPVPTFGPCQAVADYLADKLGRPVELIQGKTLREINDLAKSGEVIKEAEDFYGKSVILAARIADQARGGEVVVPPLLKELAESAGDIAFGEGREVELKGL